MAQKDSGTGLELSRGSPPSSHSVLCPNSKPTDAAKPSPAPPAGQPMSQAAGPTGSSDAVCPALQASPQLAQGRTSQAGLGRAGEGYLGRTEWAAEGDGEISYRHKFSIHRKGWERFTEDCWLPWQPDSPLGQGSKQTGGGHQGQGL